MSKPETQIIHGYTRDELNAIIEKSVLAERERCARIAEEMAQVVSVPSAVTAHHISAAIRSGK